jgi:hypothetical protein
MKFKSRWLLFLIPAALLEAGAFCASRAADAVQSSGAAAFYSINAKVLIIFGISSAVAASVNLINWGTGT